MLNKYPKTLQELIKLSVKKYSHCPSYSFVEGEPISYAEFGKRIFSTSQSLYNMGIRNGDKVAILSQNMPNWGVAYFAITTIGAVVVPLLPDFSETEIENILNHSESKAIFVSKHLQNKISNTTAVLLKTKIDIENLESLPTSKNEEEKENDIVKYEVKPEDLAAIIYTSGTTGRSKGVMLTHKNLCVQLEQTSSCQEVTENDVYLSILPLSHTYENSCGLILGTYSGASTYYLEKPATASILLPALQKIRPTLFLTVPLIIEKIFRNKVMPTIRKNKFANLLYKIPLGRKIIYRNACASLYEVFGGRLRFLGIGGAKLDPIVEKFLYEGKKIPYAIGYGLTECAPLVTNAVGNKVKTESAGFTVKNLELKINNPSSTTGEGEVWIRGENVMKGYYKNEKETHAVLTPDGWFKSGDLGFVDATGRLFLRGRLKNMILSASGENIYPEEIEFVINNFKDVVESMVVECKGKLLAMVRFNYEELEKECLRLKEDFARYKEQLANELLNYVNMRVSRFSRLAAVVPFTDEFDKTASHKIKRYTYTDKVLSKYLKN